MSTLLRERKSYYHRSKHGTVQPNEESNNKYQDIIMIGYHSKLFRDDVMAKYIDDGKHLIPWMGDETLMIDRYDCRGYLFSQEEFTCCGDSDNTNIQLTSDEKEIENQCNEERYLALQKDLTEEEFLEEEERKRFRSQYDPTCSYSNVEFQYMEEEIVNNPGDEEYDPSACFESDEEEGGTKDVPTASHVSEKALSNVAKSKSLYDDKHEIVGKYIKPEHLDIPDEIDLPDSQKAHSIIEKTALFISKQGTQMEIVLKAKQAGNPQFDFLNYGNWLNPYYKYILKKIRDGSYVPAAVSSTGQQNEQQENSGSDEDSSDDDSGNDEYIHPLLQAHRRPIKTTGKPTPIISLTSQPSSAQPRAQAVGPSVHQQLYRTTENGATHYQGSSANVVAMYMARKYENSRPSSSGSPLHGSLQEEDNDNWADQLEEDQNYFVRDASGFPYVIPSEALSNQRSLHPSFAMMSFIPPPPPPSQENDADTRHLDNNETLSRSHPTPVSSCYMISNHASSQFSQNDGTHERQQHRTHEGKQQQHIVPPPPDLKSVVDKLAEYVSRNGESFEEQIRRKQDPRFEFLNNSSTYYPYYLYRKQQKIAEVTKKKAQEKKEKEELASKPLRFALKTKDKSKTIIQKSTTVEVFMEHHDNEQTSEDENHEDFDGYRPNKATKEKTPMEKAQIAMDQAKRMIEQIQQQQKALQENAASPENATKPDENRNCEKEKQIQLERRRKAAAFIGKLKQSNTQDSMSESDDSDESEQSDNKESLEDRELRAATKRHFQEKISESDPVVPKMQKIETCTEK